MNTLIRAAGGQIARKAAPHGEDRGVHLGKATKEEIVDLGVDQVMAPTVKPWGSVRSSRGDADRLCSDKRFCKSTIKLEDASCENHIDNRR